MSASVTTTCRDLVELLPASQTACRICYSGSVTRQALKISLSLKHIAHKDEKIYIYYSAT
ncbi:hypothetical protein [Lysinibacillus pakistanensis]|uniref:hypothetical protein n=1 Tax=Lysinibacillus pakistanensis TaxID=759811 RepID=UPI0034E3BFBF